MMWKNQKNQELFLNHTGQFLIADHIPPGGGNLWIFEKKREK